MGEHTPTPWVQFSIDGRCYDIVPAGLPGVVCSFSDPPSEANAAYIVKCVNAHEGLVKALEACLSSLGWRNYSDDELRHEESLGNQSAAVILQARAALASLSEGK